MSYSFVGGGRGGNPRSSFLLVPEGDNRMQHDRPERLPETMGTGENATLLRNANCPASQSAGVSVGLPQRISCGAFGVLPRLIRGMPEIEHLLWDAQGQHLLRETPAFDVKAPPGYESVDINVSLGFRTPCVAEQEVFAHHFPLPHRVRGPDTLPGPCEQALGEYFKRRSSTLSPPAHAARPKGYGRKARSHQGPVASATSSAVSTASSPVLFSPDAIRGGITAQPGMRDEGGQGNGRVPAEAGPEQALNKLYREAASFVGLLYNSVLDTDHFGHLPSNSVTRGLAAGHLAEMISALYSPWCTRKQLIDPQLMGEMPRDQPVFDEGAGHSDVLRQLTVLRSCIKEFSLTVECMQACSAAADRLSCALRGSMVAQRGSLQAGVIEPGMDGASRGRLAADFTGTTKTGRFAHFLTLRPRSPSMEGADIAAENGGNPKPNTASWSPLVRGSSFVVESEVFVMLTEGTVHASPQAINENPFTPDAFTAEVVNAFSVPSNVGGSGSPVGLGQFHGGTGQAQAKRDVLSCLSSVLSSAISGGQDGSVSGPGGNGGPSSGERPSRMDCMQAAVAELATSLLADAGVTNQHSASGTTAWSPVMHDPAQRQRRSRKKKNSRKGGVDRSQQEPQLLSGNDLPAAETQLPSFPPLTRMQMQQLEQRLQERREDLASSASPQASGVSAAPGLKGVSQDAFDRTVFVSWIPRAARAQALSEKDAAEQKVSMCYFPHRPSTFLFSWASRRCLLLRWFMLSRPSGSPLHTVILVKNWLLGLSVPVLSFLQLKMVLSGELGISGIERVQVFPPRGSHCCIAFHTAEASMAFLMEYAGGTFTPNTEKFKRRICASFNVEFDRGIQRVFIRIEGVRMMPQAVRVTDQEKAA